MKADRLVSIIMALLERKRISARELAQQFEVSVRTIYRDIEAISMAGIPVRAVPGTGGGFEIMEAYKVDQTVFSAADLSAILTGLSGLSDMLQSEAPANALAKVRRLIPAGSEAEIACRTHQIRIDLRPWMGGGHIQPRLELVKAALETCRLLSFTYTDQHRNQTVRTVEPCQLVLKGSHWYVQCYCHVRNDYRLFRLSRMSGLRMEDETFVPRAYPPPVLDAAELLAAKQTRIRLRVRKAAADRVLDFCGPEDISPESSAYVLVDFPFVENDFYYGILLSFGDACVCLEPTHVREELRRRSLAIAALYEDDNRKG